MIYLNLNEIEKLTEIVAELVKLGMSVTAELKYGRWQIEVYK
jgi:hypothetical protein